MRGDGWMGGAAGPNSAGKSSGIVMAVEYIASGMSMMTSSATIRRWQAIWEVVCWACSLFVAHPAALTEVRTEVALKQLLRCQRQRRPLQQAKQQRLKCPASVLSLPGAMQIFKGRLLLGKRADTMISAESTSPVPSHSIAVVSVSRQTQLSCRSLYRTPYASLGVGTS
jgi:hypothetical protein